MFVYWECDWKARTELDDVEVPPAHGLGYNVALADIICKAHHWLLELMCIFTFLLIISGFVLTLANWLNLLIRLCYPLASLFAPFSWEAEYRWRGTDNIFSKFIPFLKVKIVFYHISFSVILPFKCPINYGYFFFFTPLVKF